MKATFLSDTLQKKLPFLLHAIASRSELPVLLHFLIEAKNDTISISATDLEIGITTRFAAEISEEGETTVPAKLFAELISSIGTDTISLETKDNSMSVSGKNVHATFQTLAPGDFPKLYEEKGEEHVQAKKNELTDALCCVVFAAASEASRPALSGVLLKKEASEKVLFVATDGYRLSIKTYVIEKAEGIGEKAILIPARVIREFLSLKSAEEEIHVFVSKKSNQILFDTKDTLLVGRLIDAEYPNYERIIPGEFATRAIFNREDMQKAVRICSIFARETANIVKFSLKKNTIVISANTPSVGEDSVEIDAKISGEENEIAFNAKYLLDLFANLNAETLVFEMNGPLNPGVFKIDADISFLHIIMPIRVQG